MRKRMSSPRQNWTYYRNAFSFPGLPDVDIRVMIETIEYILPVDIHDPYDIAHFLSKCSTRRNRAIELCVRTPQN